MTHRKNSKKGFTLVEIMIVVVIIGLLAAMAIPAFNKVRSQSREQDVVKNLRQVAIAGQQYILENGSTSVDYGSLHPAYFTDITPVSGESYNEITVNESGGTLAVTLANGQTVSFQY